MKEMIYETKMILYNSYFDANDKISPKSILNIFQDVASYHAGEIGVGYEDMLKQNLYWVLSRIKYDIIRMPKIDEQVIVQTWPHEKGRIDFDRDITISSLSGEPLIIGTTKWCVIDTQSRMLQRSTNVNYNGIHINKMNYEEKFNKISIPEKETNKIFNHKVVFTDLDHNKHMNNTNYASLVCNAVNNKQFTHFEINYLNECLYNDEIEVVKIEDDSKEIVIGSVNDKKAFVAMVY